MARTIRRDKFENVIGTFKWSKPDVAVLRVRRVDCTTREDDVRAPYNDTGT